MTRIKLNKNISNENEYEYYYEVVIIWSKIKKIIEKEPVNVPSTYKSTINLTIIVSLVFLIQTACLLFCNIGWYNYIIYVIVGLLLAYFIWFIVQINRLSKKLKINKGKQTISIDKESIISSVPDQNDVVIDCKNFASLVIGKYSIFIAPCDLKSFPIALSIEYKEEILEALEKEKINLNIVEINTPSKINNHIKIKEELKDSDISLKYPTLIRVLIIFLSILSIVSFGIGVIIEIFLDFSSDRLVCNDWIYLYLLIIPIL